MSSTWKLNKPRASPRQAATPRQRDAGREGALAAVPGQGSMQGRALGLGYSLFYSACSLPGEGEVPGKMTSGTTVGRGISCAPRHAGGSIPCRCRRFYRDCMPSPPQANNGHGDAPPVDAADSVAPAPLRGAAQVRPPESALYTPHKLMHAAWPLQQSGGRTACGQGFCAAQQSQRATVARHSNRSTPCAPTPVCPLPVPQPALRVQAAALAPLLLFAVWGNSPADACLLRWKRRKVCLPRRTTAWLAAAGAA